MFSPEAALKVLAPADGNGPNVAGVMLARGAMGNPFLFTKIKAALQDQSEPEISSRMKLAAARQHFYLSLQFYDQHTACVEFRKQACSYLKGVAHGAELRNQAVQCNSPEEYAEFFASWGRHSQNSEC